VAKWQKRGLPMHTFWFGWSTKLHQKKLIKSSLQNTGCRRYQGLFEVVTKNIIHGPCGAINKNYLCLNDAWKLHKTLSKRLTRRKYHWKWWISTIRRRSTEDGGKFITLKARHSDSEVENRWVLSYSWTFLPTEVAATRDWKAIVSYITKFHDCKQ